MIISGLQAPRFSRVYVANHLLPDTTALLGKPIGRGEEAALSADDLQQYPHLARVAGYDDDKGKVWIELGEPPLKLKPGVTLNYPLPTRSHIPNATVSALSEGRVQGSRINVNQRALKGWGFERTPQQWGAAILAAANKAAKRIQAPNGDVMFPLPWTV